MNFSSNKLQLSMPTLLVEFGREDIYDMLIIFAVAKQFQSNESHQKIENFQHFQLSIETQHTTANIAKKHFPHEILF